MRISPIKLRNVEFKLVLSYVDIKKFLMKSFMQDINRRNIVDYLAEVLLLTKVIQKINCNLLAIPFSIVRKLNKFSSSSFFTNTIEKDISFTRQGEAFLDESVVSYKVRSKLIIKLNGYYAIVVVSMLVDQEANKYHIYFPQLKRSFEFFLYKSDLFSAEIGLHKQAIEKGSKLNQTIGFKKAFTKVIENTDKSLGKLENSGGLISRSRLNRRYQTKLRADALDNSRTSFSSIRPSKSFHSPFSKALTTPRQARASRPVTSNFVLDDLDVITPVNVLEVYALYENKALEIIKDDVMSHRQVNLKHARECIETFANPRSLKIESRMNNFIKFYSAFYWRCMSQMIHIEERPTLLRVSLSRFEDKMTECIDSKLAIVKDQLFFVGFFMHHGDGFKLERLEISKDTKIEIRVKNLSIKYERVDMVTFKELIMNIKSKKFYPYSDPNLGNLKIACSIGCRNITKNLAMHNIRYPQESIFLEKNLRMLLSPIMIHNAPELSILGITSNIPLSPAKIKSRIHDSYIRSNMNLGKRLITSLGLADKPHTVVFLIRKIFLNDPAIQIWIFLEKNSNSIIFGFYFMETCQIEKRFIRMSFFADSLPYLSALFQTCKFFEAGERIYETMKNEYHRLYKLGTLFE
jgi:hypothetical protein